MANVLAAFFLGQTGERFEYLQIVFAFLNTLVFLPCFLMMPALGRNAKRRGWLLVLFFACSPLMMQNLTYTWTKAATAFYIVTGIWFYLAGWRKGDQLRITAGFIALAAGLLIHYSAGPWVAILTVHYLLLVWPKRRNRWKELAGIAAICGFLVGTWLLWSMAVYGADVTVTSNSSVSSSKEYQGGNGEKIVLNLLDSIVPMAVRDPSLLDRFDAQRPAGKYRDWFFLFYQGNIVFGMGLVGGPLAIYFFFSTLRRKAAAKRLEPAARGKRPPPPRPARNRSGSVAEGRFWIILVAGSIVLGISVVGERDLTGSAHLTLLSLHALGMALVAAVMPWNRKTLVALALAGCALDFSLGVLLQAHVESFENTATSTVFPGMEFRDGVVETAPPGPDALSRSAYGNWFVKHQLALHEKWLVELTGRHGQDPAFQLLLPALQKKVESVRKDDVTTWQGWFSRNGGEIQYLGDHLSTTGTTMAEGLLVVLLLGLGGLVFRGTS